MTGKMPVATKSFSFSAITFENRYKPPDVTDLGGDEATATGLTREGDHGNRHCGKDREQLHQKNWFIRYLRASACLVRKEGRKGYTAAEVFFLARESQVGGAHLSSQRPEEEEMQCASTSPFVKSRFVS
jgi:hypothetical protein